MRRAFWASAFAVLLALPVRAEVVWLEKDYDFGLMKEAAGPAGGRVRLVNHGPEEVAITGARPSCGCTSVDFSEEPIAPGDTAVISFTYDPAGRPGKFDKSIRVYVGQNDSYRIGIRGNVLGTPESLDQFYPHEAGGLRLSDIVVSGGEMTHGTARNFFVNAYNQTADSISPLAVSSNPALKVTVSQPKMGPGDIATFSLFFNSGAIQDVGDIVIPVSIADGPEAEAEKIDVEFRAKVTPDFSRMSADQVEKAPRCYLIPERVDLGIISGDKSLKFSARIQNQGKEKMNVLRIIPQESAVKVKSRPAAIKPSKDAEAVFSINPELIPEGAFNLKVEVITDDPLHPIRVLSVVGIKE